LNAFAFNPRSRRENGVPMDHLLETVSTLFDLLAEREADYLLVGGIALLQYVEGRNTEDIDLIMAMSDIRKIPEMDLTHQEAHFARGQFEGLRIDFLLTENPVFDRVKRTHSTVKPFAERDIPCVTVEGLALLKLYALPSLYRQGNFARVGLYENDLATLLHGYREALDMESLLDQLAPHLGDADVSALREIIADIEQRIDRFGKGIS
ncbi:MAG: hypothetical protein ACLFTV_10195, partial [Desulfococcaceae bacterium]